MQQLKQNYTYLVNALGIGPFCHPRLEKQEKTIPGGIFFLTDDATPVTDLQKVKLAFVPNAIPHGFDQAKKKNGYLGAEIH